MRFFQEIIFNQKWLSTNYTAEEDLPTSDDDGSKQLSPIGSYTSVRRSSSTEALRLLTRKATTRRSSVHRRTTVAAKPSSSSAQLDAIQRSQKMLDARLQDLQTFERSEDSNAKENMRHVRMLLTEMQKALGLLVKSMSSTQYGMQNIATAVTAILTQLTQGKGNLESYSRSLGAIMAFTVQIK